MPLNAFKYNFPGNSQVTVKCFVFSQKLIHKYNTHVVRMHATLLVCIFILTVEVCSARSPDQSTRFTQKPMLFLSVRYACEWQKTLVVTFAWCECIIPYVRMLVNSLVPTSGGAGSGLMPSRAHKKINLCSTHYDNYIMLLFFIF